MSKLSDTQVIILSAAAQRPDGNVRPLPGSLRDGAAAKLVGALLVRGLIREHVIDSPRKADAAMNTIWRNLPEPDGRGVLLFITTAGAEAIGVEPPVTPDDPEQAAAEPVGPAAVPYAFNEGANSAGEPAAGAPKGAYEAPVESAPKRRGRPWTAAPTGADVGAAPNTRGDTKQAQLIAMLRPKEGASIAQIVTDTGWQPHYADVRIMPR